MIKTVYGTCNIVKASYSDDRLWTKIQDFHNSLGYVYEYSIEDYFFVVKLSSFIDVLYNVGQT